MSKVTLLAVGALLAVSAPALAQSGSSGSQMNQGSTQNRGSMTNQSPTQVREQIRQDLTQAGFTDVTVVPGDFIVQGKNKSGQPVLMVIGPHSVTGLVGTASDADKGNTTGSTTGTSNSSK